MTNLQFISPCFACALFVHLWSCSDASVGDGAHGGSSGAGSGAMSGGAATGGSRTGGAANLGGTDARGGAGPGPGLTLEEACEKTCADQSALNCAFDSCVTECRGLSSDGDLEAPDEYLSMLRCQAEQLWPSDYSCLAMDPDPVVWPAPNAATSCESAICAWYCAESTLWGNYAVYLRCDCAGAS